MPGYIRTFLLVFILLLTSLPAHAAPIKTDDLPAKQDIAFYSLTPDQASKLGNDIEGVLVFTIAFDKDWHAYANNPGEIGKPTELKVATADGKAIRILYPKGHAQKDVFDPSVTINAYEGTVRIFGLLPKGWQSGKLTASLETLFCSPTSCLPSLQKFSWDTANVKLAPAEKQPWFPKLLSLAGVDASPSKTTPAKKIPIKFETRSITPSLEVGGLLMAMFLGVLAGLILNAMPCVLPVVSLKISTLFSTCTEINPKVRYWKFREHNIFFSLGILSWFTMLALVLGLTGQAWGELFQHAWMVTILVAIVFALSLSMFGLYNLPVIDLKFDQGTTNPKLQAYFTGVLATLLATPCSGPFLGGVLGWALIQPTYVVIAVFLSIGFGMSLPYLVMCIFPGISFYLPKPGPWIAYVEKGVGFFLAGTCIYLINILPDQQFVPVLVMCWLIVPAAWLWGLAGPAMDNPKRTILRSIAAALAIVLVFWASQPRTEDFQWEPYNPTTFEAALGTDMIFLDFTANWCPTCKFIEKTVLIPKNLAKWKKDHTMRFIKVDLTSNNPEGEKLLHSLGSKSIPMAAVFGKGDKVSKPVVLRDLFTKAQIEEAINSLK